MSTTDNLHPTASAATNAPVGEEQADVHPSAIGPEPKVSKSSSGVSLDKSRSSLNQSQSVNGGVNGTSEDQQQDDSERGADDLDESGYPPQLHAGKVGLGPHFGEKKGDQKEGFIAKIIGTKEELKGKITRNPELVQRGHDRKTGELQRKAKEQGEASPFGTTGDKNDSKEKEDTPSSEETDANAHPNEKAPGNNASEDKFAKEEAATSNPETTKAGQEEASKGQKLEREASMLSGDNVAFK